MLDPVLLCVEAFNAVSSMVYSLYKELHFPGITSFFSIVKQVVQVWEQKSVMTSLPEMPSVNEFRPILKRLMLNAEKNLDRLPKQ